MEIFITLNIKPRPFRSIISVSTVINSLSFRKNTTILHNLLLNCPNMRATGSGERL